ncbi:hypothetical protein ABT112_18820 [Streptomyces sp. NPDC002055]|uniref:hypothetical protein n=1 Tax=Streptomyces sp. NPDC002055 TaxID=3154534 RepID=UPI0033174B57
MADARRRVRSGTVILGSMGALAAVLTACGSEPDKRCVDRDSYEYDKGYRVVDTKQCSGTTSAKSRSRRDAAWYYDADVENGWAEDGHFDRSHSSSGGSSGGSKGGSSVERGGFGHGSGHGSSGG